MFDFSAIQHILILQATGFFESFSRLSLLQHHVLADALTGITTFALGFLVFTANPSRRLNQVFGLYSLSIVWWATTESLVISAHNLETATIWAFLDWVGVCFIGPTFLHSAILVSETKSKWARKLLILAYISAIYFLILHFGCQAIMGSVRAIAYVPYFNSVTRIGLLVPGAFFICVNASLYLLCGAYRRSTGQRRVQLKFLFWASLFGYLGGSPDWFLILGFYCPGLNPFGIYAVPLYSIATTYAVLYHRLFGFRLVIRKSLVYSLVVTLLTTGYFGLVYAIERLFQTTFGYQSFAISFFAFALMALAFQPLKIGIQRMVDQLLFGKSYEHLARQMERLTDEARKGERFKLVSTLAAGLAHEVKNPLAAIKTFTDFLGSRYDDPEFRAKFIRVVGREVEHINLIVQHLLNFAKPSPPKLVPLDARQLLDETLELLGSELVRRHVEVARQYDRSEQILGDPQQLKQVFLNLLLNSLDAMNGSGTLAIETMLHGANMEVKISDNGCGMSPEVQSCIFDPFFTTKEHGTGLGLSVARGIIEEHGGRIEVESKPGQGTAVHLFLPVSVAS